MIRGITFSEQTFYSADFAHYMNFFLQGGVGITKGCLITNDGTKVTIGTGYFVAHGRLLNVEVAEVVEATQGFESGYNRIVYEIDLSKENTITDFRQGAIRVLHTEDLVQEDLDAAGLIYQFPVCHFQWSGAAIEDFAIDAPTLVLDDIFKQWSENFEVVNAQFDEWFAAQKTDTLDWVDQQKKDFDEYASGKKNEMDVYVLACQQMIAELQAQGFENAAVYVDDIMFAANWEEDIYPFTDYPFGSYDIEIQPSVSCTKEQIEAWGKALIVGSTTSNNATAKGEVPSIDIPIIIKVVRKSGVESVVLMTGDYTGEAEVTTNIDGEEYDVENMTANPETAESGDVIINGEGES